MSAYLLVCVLHDYIRGKNISRNIYSLKCFAPRYFHIKSSASDGTQFFA